MESMEADIRWLVLRRRRNVNAGVSMAVRRTELSSEFPIEERWQMDKRNSGGVLGGVDEERRAANPGLAFVMRTSMPVHPIGVTNRPKPCTGITLCYLLEPLNR